MIAYKKNFNNEESGASMLEVLLAMAITGLVAPFLYMQIAETNKNLSDMVLAKNIVSLEDEVIDFIRVNQVNWPDAVQIKLSEEELDSISEMPVAGFIDKYLVENAAITDVYLAFDFAETDLHTAKIASYIGNDAAVVGQDGIAYGRDWAVSAPDFKQGYLIYKITRDLKGEDKTKYLHRGTTGEDELNKMLRNLNMNNNNIYNIGVLSGKSIKSTNGSSYFIETGSLISDATYFSNGANLEGDTAYFDSIKVSKDISGFRNIYANSLNGNKYTTKGRIVADRVSILNSVNVGQDLVVKSDSTRTISGFSEIKANSVYLPFLYTDEIIFYEDFGLTISGELLMSTTSPLKVGDWYFPSLYPPLFYDIRLDRATIPPLPDSNNFGPLMTSEWKDIPAKQ